MGSKSIIKKMKSYEINKSEAEIKLKNQKKENASDIISKSLLKSAPIPARQFFQAGFRRVIINLVCQLCRPLNL